MSWSDAFAAMALAMALDVAMGWPLALYRRLGHPVTWIGALVRALETRLNRGRVRMFKGVVAWIVVVGGAALVAGLLQMLAPHWALVGVLAWPLVATRSMHDHVAAVALPLAAGDLNGARAAVAMIVGRNPDLLDAPGVARAATESLAENTSDGILAPLFWGVVAGLPGIAAYKAINTLDSMIGHRNDRYRDFGWASARLDDLANLAPARLTGAVFALVSPRPVTALRCMLRDARYHRSPNAGWPEAAMAGALGIRLSGPRVYEDRVADEPWLNAGAPDPTAKDLGRGLALFRRAMVVVWVALVCGGVIL